MAKHLNTFNQGMDQDSSKNKYDTNHYFDANNLRIISQAGLSSGALEVTDGNTLHLQVFADGYAYYVITKETSRTVTVKVLKGLGDDWTLPMWGNGCTTSKKVVVEYLNSQDALSKLFGGKR